MNDSLAIIVGPNRIDKQIADVIQSHDRTIMFEPLPDACEFMRSQINQGGERVRIVQAACGQFDGTSVLNQYNTHGVSSSLGTCTKQSTELYERFDLNCTGQLEVPVVNLAAFCARAGIYHIDTLMTDAQGMDLTIMKTMSKWLRESLISKIQCEADGDGYCMYDGLPNNSESGFDMLFSEFPQYIKSRLPNRVPWNPDLTWALAK